MKDHKIERDPTNGMTINDEIKYLDEMSRLGWDLVTILDSLEFPGSAGNHIYDYYFSREIARNSQIRKRQLKEDDENDTSKSGEATGAIPETGI